MSSNKIFTEVFTEAVFNKSCKTVNILDVMEANRIRAGQRLRAARLARGLTQADVERLSREIAIREGNPKFAISKWQVSAVEHGAQMFPPKVLALLKIYDLSLGEALKIWSGRDLPPDSDGSGDEDGSDNRTE